MDANISALIKRGFLELEEGQWEKADEFFENALNVEAEAGMAYLGKLMVEFEICEKDKLCEASQPLDSSANYKRAIRFGEDELKAFLEETNRLIHERLEEERLKKSYNEAVEFIKGNNYADAVKLLEQLGDYKDTKRLIMECKEKLDTQRKEKVYDEAVSLLNEGKTKEDIKNAAELFASVINFKDAKAKITECKEKYENFQEPDIVEDEENPEETNEEWVYVPTEEEVKKLRGDRVFAYVLMVIIFFIIVYAVLNFARYM